MLVLCNFSKLFDPQIAGQQYTPPPPSKIKISDRPPAKTSKNFNALKAGGGACHELGSLYKLFFREIVNKSKKE